MQFVLTFLKREQTGASRIPASAKNLHRRFSDPPLRGFVTGADIIYSVGMSPYLSLHRLFRRLQQKNRFVGRVVHTGLTPLETFFLLELDAVPTRTISALAALLDVDESLVSRTAQALTRRGMLSIVADPADRRRKRLRITELGCTTIKKVDTVATRLYRQFAHDLSRADELMLVKLFRAIADGLGHPAGIRRRGEAEYRVQQRRITRCFGLLGHDAFGSGLSSTAWQTLTEVVQSPVPISPSRLVPLLTLAQNSLSSTIAGLAREGLIECRRNNIDGRSTTLHPLPAGRALVSRVEKNAAKDLQRALRSWTSRQIENAVRVFATFVGESDTSITPLPASAHVTKLASPQLRGQARGVFVRNAVRAGREESLPEKIFASDSQNYGLLQGGKLLAAVQLEPTRNTRRAGATARNKRRKASDPTRITLAVWQPSLSPSIMLGFIHQALRSSGIQQPVPRDAVDYLPLRDYLWRRS